MKVCWTLTHNSDMSPQHDIFNNVIEHFSASEEGVRTAAAFSAGICACPVVFIFVLTGPSSGNIAIGNLHQFLPAILRISESDPSKRLLSLHALKEVRKITFPEARAEPMTISSRWSRTDRTASSNPSQTSSGSLSSATPHRIPKNQLGTSQPPVWES